MKISDLKNYETPSNEHGKISFFTKKKKTVNSAKIMMQGFVDFTLCTIFRVVFGIILFKFLIRNVPIEQLLKMTTSEEAIAFVKHYSIMKHGIVAISSVMALGALYYILLISKTEKGTVGSWLMNVRFRLPNGKRPGVMQVGIWYFSKALYPIFGVLCVIVYFSKGLCIAFFVLFILTAFFSNIPAMIFGIRTFAEMVSSIAIVKSDK